MECGVAEVLPQTIDLLPNLGMLLEEVDQLACGDTKRLGGRSHPSLTGHQHVQNQTGHWPERRMFYRAGKLAGLESEPLPHYWFDHCLPVRGNRDSLSNMQVQALPQTLQSFGFVILLRSALFRNSHQPAGMMTQANRRTRLVPLLASWPASAIGINRTLSQELLIAQRRPLTPAS